MALAPRSFTAFRLTEEEQVQIKANDADWVLDPATGVLEAEAVDELDVPLPAHQARPKRRVRLTFQLPDMTFD